MTKHGRKPPHKRKSLLVIQSIQEALWRKLNNLKPLFSHNEELFLHQEGKSCQLETITAENQYVCHDFSV